MAPTHLLLLSYQQFYQRTLGNYNGFYFLNIDEGYYIKDTNESHIHKLPHQYFFFFWLLYNFYICARRVLLPLNSLLWEGDSLRLAGRTSVYTLICYRVYGGGCGIRTHPQRFQRPPRYRYANPQYIMTLGWSAAHTSYTNFCSLSFYNYIISNYFKSFNYAHELRQQEHQLPEMPHSSQ